MLFMLKQLISNFKILQCHLKEARRHAFLQPVHKIGDCHVLLGGCFDDLQDPMRGLSFVKSKRRVGRLR